MTTRKMTRAQLRAAIAGKQGWKPTGGGTFCGEAIPDWRNKGAKAYSFALPDYLTDMNAAMPLLRELPLAEFDYEMHKLIWVGVPGRKHYGCEIDFEVPKEAEAIACAWWQWKTGEVVELVSE